MTRDQAVAQIQSEIGFRSDLNTQIEEYLRTEQAELEKRDILPWWLVTEVSNISTVIGEERVPVPDDFLREYEDPDGGDQLWYFNSSAPDDEKWTVLVKHDMETLREAYPASGPPRLYALTGKYFRLAPTPDAAYTIKMVYYKQDDVLATNIENGWLRYSPNLLIGRAGMRIAGPLNHDKAYQRFSLLAGDSSISLDKSEEARGHANRRYIIGGVD